MRAIIIFSIVAFFAIAINAQVNNIYQSGGISQTVGAPTYKPGAKGNIVAIDTVTGIWYISRDRYSVNWLSMGDRIESISGCSAPAYIPNKYNSELVINNCTTPQLYHYNGATWDCLNCSSSITTDATLSGAGTSGSPLKIAQQAATSGQVLKWNGTTWLPAADAGTTYTAGAGIDVTGTVISNTGDLSNTNELQNLSLSGQALSISGGTGVTLPIIDVAAGTGISVAKVAGVATVTNTGDLSNTNEIQRLDTFTLVGSTLRASLLNDGVPFSSVDLSGLVPANDRLGTGFTAGGGSGTIPDETIAEIGGVSNTNILLSYQGVTDAKKTGFSATDGLTNEYFAGILYLPDDDITEVSLNAGGNGFTADPNTMLVGGNNVNFNFSSSFTIQDNSVDQFGLVMIADQSATIIPNARSIPDVGTVKQLYTAGTGISIADAGNFRQITNTAPNVTTNLTFSGSSSPVTLNSSDGTDVTYTAGTGTSLSATSGNMTINNTGVTSVALSLPSIFSVSGSPVTNTGTLAGTLATQTANMSFMGPTSGGAATPAFRALVAADIPAGIASLWTDGGATTYLTATGDNVAIGGTSAASKLDVITNSLGVTQTDVSGIVLSNNTAAAAGAQQISPALRWRGQGWKTDATAASRTVDWRAYALPTQGAANPKSLWVVDYSVNGASYTNSFRISMDGYMNVGSDANAAFGMTSTGTTFSSTGTSWVLAETNSSQQLYGYYLYGNPRTNTSGTSGVLDVGAASGGYTVSSGSGQFNGINWAQTITQSGTASGATRGLYLHSTINQTGSATGSVIGIDYNPTLTSVLGTHYGLLIQPASTLNGVGTATPARLWSVQNSDAVTNTVTYAQRNTHITSGTATTGFGGGQELELENASGTNRVAQTQETTWSDAVNATEDATYTLKLTRAGTLTAAQTTLSTGETTFAGDVTVPDEAYGSGWDASLEVPTKNAVYDKVQALNVTSGTYTPTLTGVTNVTASTPQNCQYTRNGNIVTVFGSLQVTTTLAVSTEVGISLPIASNLAAATDLNGVANASSAIASNAYTEGDATNDRASLKFIGLSVGGAGTLFFSFSYTVI